ncbi:MAG: hypothetical protein C0506_13245, partial [Anaerolinea sp.]|nr:hypothetical protein [Anaerolinea sp.]
MAMDTGGERPADGGEESSETSDNWYFNLPSGAWERQEEKNRQLRERVHSNLEEDPLRHDPFAARKDERHTGLFGLGKKKEEPEQRTTPGGTFRLVKPGHEDPAELFPSADGDDDWTSEPVIPLRRRPSDTPPPASALDDDGGAGDGDDPDIVSSMRKWVSGGTAGPASPADHAHSRRQGVPEDTPAFEPPPPTVLPLKLHRSESATPGDDDTPARWKEVFSSEAAEPEGLAAMREWAEKGPVLPERHEPLAEIPEEFLKPFEWETDEAAHQNREIPPELLKPFEWEAEPEPRPEADARPQAEAAAPAVFRDWAREDALAAVELSHREPPPGSPPSLYDPADAADSRDDARPDASQPPGEATELAPRGGLLGRMFGRKKQHEAPSATDRDIRFAGRQGDAAEALPALERDTPEDAGWLPVDAAIEAEEPRAPRHWPAETRPIARDDAPSAWRLTTGIGLEALERADDEESPLFE